MAEGNVERIRRGIDAFNRRDFDAALAMVRDDVTWKRFISRAEADSVRVRGKEELRAIPLSDGRAWQWERDQPRDSRRLGLDHG